MAPLCVAAFTLLAVFARADCLPPGPPFAPAAAVTQAPQASLPPRRAIILSDVSGSMRGFSSKRASAYSNIYRTLPELLRSLDAVDISYYRVGASVEPLPERFFYLAPSQIFYCPPKFVSSPALSAAENDYFRGVCLDARGRPSGFNRESRIDRAVAKVAQEQAAGGLNLAVIVTDLFVTAGELEVGFGAAFSASVADLLRQGVAVGIIGIEAPFDGTVFDLQTYPDASKNGPHHSGTRPFFLIVFGSPERIRTFDEAMTAEVKHRHGVTVFRHYGQPVSLPDHLAAVGNVQPRTQINPSLFARIREVSDDLRRMKDYDRISLMTLPQPNSPRWKPVTAGVVLPDGFQAADALAGKIEIVSEETLTYAHGKEASCSDRWKPVWNDHDKPLTSIDSDGQVVMFGDKSLAAQFVRATRDLGDIFLHRAKLRWVPDKSRPGSPRPPPKWVGEFGFSTEDEIAVLNKLRDPPRPASSKTQTLQPPVMTTGFFPAMNLPELVKKLSQVERGLLQPIDLGYFVIAWQFEN